MKKYAILICALLVAAACDKAETGTAGEETVRISLSAGVAQDYTRADGTAVTADRCILEIYNADGTLYGDRTIAYPDADGVFAFEPSVVSGHSYKFVFWADKSGTEAGSDLHYSTADGLRNITLAGDSHTACDAERDAFFAAVDVEATKSQAVSATLRRAVCRLNISTGFKADAAGTYTVKAAFADAFTRFDAFDGSVSGKAAVEAAAEVTANAAGDELVWYDLLFAPSEAGESVDFEMTATLGGNTTGMPDFQHSFSSIPVQRNYRVNVSRPQAGTSSVRLSAEL